VRTASSLPCKKTRTWWLAAAATVTAATLATGLSLPSAASAAPSSSGDVIASGVVVGATGQAAAGSTIDLYAWPQSNVLDAMQVGQTVPTVLLATATASASGKYALAITPGVLKPYANSAGYANLEVRSGPAVWDFPAKAADPAPVTVPALDGGRPGAGGSCTQSSLYKKLPRYWVTVLEGYITGSKRTVGDTYYATYTQSASSSLSIGVSFNNPSGGWNLAGTDSESSGWDVYYPSMSNNGGQLDRTQFASREFYWECTYPDGGGPPKCFDYCTVYQVRATGWIGSSGEASTSNTFKHPGWTCASEVGGPDGGVGENNTKAITWTGGFSVTAVGFSGNAQTGYTKEATINYDVPVRGTYYACGSNNVPPNAARVLIKA
jgi:hypothetical protein